GPRGGQCVAQYADDQPEILYCTLPVQTVQRWQAQAVVGDLWRKPAWITGPRKAPGGGAGGDRLVGSAKRLSWSIKSLQALGGERRRCRRVRAALSGALNIAVISSAETPAENRKPCKV